MCLSSVHGERGCSAAPLKALINNHRGASHFSFLHTGRHTHAHTFSSLSHKLTHMHPTHKLTHIHPTHKLTHTYTQLTNSHTTHKLTQRNRKQSTPSECHLGKPRKVTALLSLSFQNPHWCSASLSYPHTTSLSLSSGMLYVV